MKTLIKYYFSLLACVLTAQAQLVVTVSAPKVVGQKVIVELAMTNNLAAPIESARAVCFLLDEQGEMKGQSTKWVIGGTKNRPALQPQSGTTFNFVITTPQPFISTNLTAKVSFNRIVFVGGQSADITKAVKLQTPP